MVICSFSPLLQHYKQEDIAALYFYGKYALEREVFYPLDHQDSNQFPLQVDLPIRDLLFDKAVIYAWIFCYRILNSDGSVAARTTTETKQQGRLFVVRAGVATIPISKLKGSHRVTDTAQDGSIGELQCTGVGTQSVQTIETPEGHACQSVLFSRDVKLITPLLEETEKQLDVIHKRFSKSNIPTEQLARAIFLHIPHPCGRIPVWMFPLLYLEKGTMGDNYLQNSLQNARMLSGILAPKTATDWAELLSEMQTMAVRNQLYVADLTKRCCGQELEVDDWTNPLQYRKLAKFGGLDCEDATLRMMQEASLLRNCYIQNTQSLLYEAQQIEHKYFTFFSGMTLFLPAKKSWVYHAACLKLDKLYVLKQLGEAIPESKEAYAPSILMEGTAYTTGCYDYKTSEEKLQILRNSQIQLPDSGLDSNVKVTMEFTKKNQMYGHIQTLVCPELFALRGVVQIELSYENRLAAPFQQVMEYNPNVGFHYVEIAPADIRPVLKELQTSLPDIPLPVLPVQKTKNEDLLFLQPKKYACCFRACDWKENSLEEFAKAMNTTALRARVREIVIDSDLSFMYVFE